MVIFPSRRAGEPEDDYTDRLQHVVADLLLDRLEDEELVERLLAGAAIGLAALLMVWPKRTGPGLAGLLGGFAEQLHHLPKWVGRLL